MTEEKKKITRQTNIMEALELNPNSAEILMDVGLGCIGCGFSQMESLEQGLGAHGFGDDEINRVIDMLNE